MHILDCSHRRQKRLRRNARLLEDGAERSFRHVAGMVRNSGVTVGGRVVLELMRAGSLAVELEAEAFEPLHNLPVTKAGEASHQALTIKG